MNARSLTLLIGTTAVVAGVATLTLHHRENSVRATEESRTLFPELNGSLNDVVRVTVQRKDGAYTLQKSGDSWGLAEKKGYPVDIPSVRKALIAIADLKTVEAKTSDPKRLGQLGLAEPDAEGSTSSLVTLEDAGGKKLAALVVGKTHEGKGYGATGQLYVRKAGDPQAWLASGALDLHEKSTEWLDKSILKVEHDRVRSVEVSHSDGEVLRVDRDKPEETAFTLHDIPEGKDLTYPTVAGSLASALEYLSLEDVVPAAEMDMKEGAAATTKFACFDGLVVTVTTKDVGDKTYAHFAVAFEAPSPSEVAGPPAPEIKEGDAAKPNTPEKAKPKTPDEVKKEVDELNARLSAWTYVVPSYSKTSFEKRKSEMLKDKAPPPAPKEGESTEGVIPHLEMPSGQTPSGNPPPTPVPTPAPTPAPAPTPPPTPPQDQGGGQPSTEPPH